MNFELSTYEKYTPQQRNKLRRRIKELRKQTKSSKLITETLNNEGFTSPNGSPLTPSQVAAQSYQMNKTERNKKIRAQKKRAKTMQLKRNSNKIIKTVDYEEFPKDHSHIISVNTGPVVTYATPKESIHDSGILIAKIHKSKEFTSDEKLKLIGLVVKDRN